MNTYRTKPLSPGPLRQAAIAANQIETTGPTERQAGNFDHDRCGIACGITVVTIDASSAS
jgi:hypothetical protein